MEAKASAIERSIVAKIVAHGQLDAQAEQLKTLEDVRAERQSKLHVNEAARARLDVRSRTPSGTLEALRAASTRAGIPVLLYWTTYAQVIAWYVGPEGSDVRAVLFPPPYSRRRLAMR